MAIAKKVPIQAEFEGKKTGAGYALESFTFYLGDREGFSPEELKAQEIAFRGFLSQPKYGLKPEQIQTLLAKNDLTGKGQERLALRLRGIDKLEPPLVLEKLMEDLTAANLMDEAASQKLREQLDEKKLSLWQRVRREGLGAAFRAYTSSTQNVNLGGYLPGDAIANYYGYVQATNQISPNYGEIIFGAACLFPTLVLAGGEKGMLASAQESLTGKAPDYIRPKSYTEKAYERALGRYRSNAHMKEVVETINPAAKMNPVQKTDNFLATYEHAIGMGANALAVFWGLGKAYTELKKDGLIGAANMRMAQLIMAGSGFTFSAISPKPGQAYEDSALGKFTESNFLTRILGAPMKWAYNHVQKNPNQLVGLAVGHNTVGFFGALKAGAEARGKIRGTEERTQQEYNGKHLIPYTDKDGNISYRFWAEPYQEADKSYKANKWTYYNPAKAMKMHAEEGKLADYYRSVISAKQTGYFAVDKAQAAKSPLLGVTSVSEGAVETLHLFDRLRTRMQREGKTSEVIHVGGKPYITITDQGADGVSFTIDHRLSAQHSKEELRELMKAVDDQLSPADKVAGKLGKVSDFLLSLAEKANGTPSESHIKTEIRVQDVPKPADETQEQLHNRRYEFVDHYEANREFKTGKGDDKVTHAKGSVRRDERVIYGVAPEYKMDEAEAKEFTKTATQTFNQRRTRDSYLLNATQNLWYGLTSNGPIAFVGAKPSKLDAAEAFSLVASDILNNVLKVSPERRMDVVTMAGYMAAEFAENPTFRAAVQKGLIDGISPDKYRDKAFLKQTFQDRIYARVNELSLVTGQQKEAATVNHIRSSVVQEALAMPNLPEKTRQEFQQKAQNLQHEASELAVNHAARAKEAARAPRPDEKIGQVAAQAQPRPAETKEADIAPELAQVVANEATKVGSKTAAVAERP